MSDFVGSFKTGGSICFKNKYINLIICLKCAHLWFLKNIKSKELYRKYFSTITSIKMNTWVSYKSFALNKDLRDQCGYNAPSSMRSDPISWKQSLFTASDRANLFGRGRWRGGLSHAHFRTVQPVHVQYILEAEAIDLCSSLHRTNTPLFHLHLFVSALHFPACLSALNEQQDDAKPAI